MSESEALDLAALLNPEQHRAATTTEGPLLILAGAGSGKTRVLVHRIAHLVQTGLAKPREIFAVTFTNKAAGEMRARLAKVLGRSIEEAWIGTFHALSARLLRIEGRRLGYSSSFTIYDDDDSKRLMKTIVDELGIDLSSSGTTLGSIANEIDRAKNHGLSVEQFLELPKGDDPLPRSFARRIYPRYQEALRRANAMDFGDLILLAVALLSHHPEARAKFQERFHYVLVDEFQDTNTVQYALLKVLVDRHRNLAVVGDDDQAIYRWRGADVGNILGFEHDYPDATVVKLERNYRSTANILEAANAVIRRNRRRHAKALRTTEAAGARVGVTLLATSEDEATFVAQLIGERIQRGERPEEFAILYRQNAQSRLFEESLRRYRVPFVLIGGTGFYERAEVKDVLSYLRLTANPRSRQDFDRIVNTPTRRIGDKTIAALRTVGEAAGLEGAEMLSLDDVTLARAELKRTAIDSLRALDRTLAELRELARTASASEVARAVIEKTGYVEHLRRTEPQSADDRVANVEELVSSIAEHEARAADSPSEDGLGIAGAKTPLEAFLDSAALVSTNDEPSRAGSVSMLTLHSAKGLEFPYVFIVGMEEQTFPAKRALESEPEAMEEERRLCYVGMTRAMRELFLVAARHRRIYGREEVRWPSRFLGDLPDDIVGAVEPTSRAASREPAYSHPASGATAGRSVTRGGDRIVYDADIPDVDAEDMGEIGPHRRAAANRAEQAIGSESADVHAIRPGTRVVHNTFGEGTVEDADGRGPSARLTIRFPEAGVRRVVARFVRSVEES